LQLHDGETPSYRFRALERQGGGGLFRGGRAGRRRRRRWRR
jgi:hypothetical protein